MSLHWWTLWKSAFANWALCFTPSVKVARRTARRAREGGEVESSISAKRLRARRAGLSRKVLTGDGIGGGGVDEGLGITS